MKMTGWHYQIGLLASSAIVLSLALASNTGAQAPKPQHTKLMANQQPRQIVKPINQRPTGQSPVEQDTVYKSQPLTQEVALPNLPSYTGKKVFISGLQYPNAKDGPGYYLVYNTEHPESDVKEWWKAAFKGDPTWKLTSTDESIRATSRDGSQCHVVVANLLPSSPEKMKGMRGSYSIYFHVVQKYK